MADLDLDIPPVVPNSANPEVAVNTGFDKVKAALILLNEAAAEPGGGLPEGGTVGQFLALLAGGVAAWVDPPSGGGGGGGGAGGVSNAGPHKWWRLLVTKSNIDQRYCNFTEVGFMLTSDGASQTTGGTAIAGDFYSSNGPANAFDGILATAWESGANRTDLSTNPAWIGYEFAAPVEVNFVKVQVGSYENDEWPTRFNVEYSDDGISWQEAWKVPEYVWTGTGDQSKTFDIRTKAFAVPEGGTTGQALVKASAADGDTRWSSAGGGGGGGEIVLASAILTITDPGGTIVDAQSRKNNIASVTRISAGKFKFTFTKPLPDLFVHVSASCTYGPFDDEWASYVRLPRRASERLTVNQITLDCPQQNGGFYDPVRLEFKITAFAAEITTPVEPGVSAKDWRLLFPEGSNGGNPNGFMRLTGVEFRKVAGVAENHNGQGTPISTGTPVEPMSNAFDGNAATYWDAKSDTAIGSYCGFSFTDARSVTQLAIIASRFESFAPKSFKLQYMKQDNTWVDVYTSATPLSWTGDETKLFTIP